MRRRRSGRSPIVRIDQVCLAVPIHIRRNNPGRPAPRRNYHRLLKLLAKRDERRNAEPKKTSRLKGEASNQHVEHSWVRTRTVGISAIQDGERDTLKIKELL